MDDEAALLKLVGQLTGRRAVRAERIFAGRNSRVYRATCEDSVEFAVKQYAEHANLERLATEFGALELLHAHGFSDIPRPVAQDRARRVGVYEYIPGAPLAQASDADVMAAVQFVGRLAALSAAAPEWDVPAAEAFFSMHDVAASIRVRVARFIAVPLGTPEAHDLHAFLRDELTPLLNDVVAWGEKQLASAGMSMRDVLPPAGRILSPSDFGFHNAIRREDGAPAFVDFEYFGWDDPAKLISDFFLHPAMALSEAQKRAFASGVCAALPGGGTLAKRLPVARAFFGVKWCAILLNEFLPGEAARRAFAGDARSGEEMRAAQLAKARAMHRAIADTYREFQVG